MRRTGLDTEANLPERAVLAEDVVELIDGDFEGQVLDEDGAGDLRGGGPG